MAPLPDVTIAVQDGGLGVVPASPANTIAKVGVCSGGTVNTLYGFNDTGTLVSTLGYGPLVEAVASTLKAAGGPVYAMPVNPSAAGSAGSVTHTIGSGAGTVTPTLASASSVAIKIVGAGSSGIATYQVSVGGGAYGPTLTTATTAAPVAGTMMQVSFPTGTYVLNDVWTFASNTTTATVTGSGSTAPTGTFSPSDSYQVQIKIIAGGALGTATFQYSLDAGLSWSPTILIASGGVYAIPGAGMFVTFASTFNAGDVYSFTTTTAGYSNTDLTNALTALMANSQTWGYLHVVGAASNSAGAASVAGVVKTAIEGASSSFRFAGALVECPNTEADSAIKTAFASFASSRMSIGCGDAMMVSPLSGRTIRRNPCWAASNRIAFAPPGRDLAYVGDGPLSQVQSLTRDEFATPGLDDAGFITLRTFPDLRGYYISNGRVMSAGGSDFQYVQHRRVMDRACSVVRQAMLNFLNSSVRVDRTTGFIDERDASRFEMTVNAQLAAAIVATGDASSSTVTMSRTQNILSTNSEPVTVRIVPLGYLKTISVNIGFTNPALTS
jgi:hypothetical protein